MEEEEEEAIHQLTSLTISVPNSSEMEGSGSASDEGVNDSSSGDKGVNESVSEISPDPDAPQDEGTVWCSHVTMMS